MNFIPDSLINTVVALTVVPLVINQGSQFLTEIINQLKKWKNAIFTWLFPTTHVNVPEVFRVTSSVINNELYKTVMWYCDRMFQENPKTLKYGSPFYFQSSFIKTDGIVKEYRNDFLFVVERDNLKFEILHTKSQSPAYFSAKTKTLDKIQPSTTDEMQFRLTLKGNQNRQLLDSFVENIFNEHKQWIKEGEIRMIHIVESPTNLHTMTFDIKTQFDHLLLCDTIRKELTLELDGFYSERTKKCSLPNRLGLMFCGLPGCGKTSLIKAISKKYSIDVYKINSFQPSSTTESKSKYIQEMFHQLSRNTNSKKRVLWLFEDIDCLMECVQERKNDEINDGLSYVLNALDGITTPDEILIIFTSNRPWVLDPALVRPGRIDRVFSLGHVFERALLEKFCLQFLDESEIQTEFFDFVKMNQLTPSMIASILRSAQRTSIPLMTVAQQMTKERKIQEPGSSQ